MVPLWLHNVRRSDPSSATGVCCMLCLPPDCLEVMVTDVFKRVMGLTLKVNVRMHFSFIQYKSHWGINGWEWFTHCTCRVWRCMWNTYLPISATLYCLTPVQCNLWVWWTGLSYPQSSCCSIISCSACVQLCSVGTHLVKNGCLTFLWQ